MTRLVTVALFSLCCVSAYAQEAVIRTQPVQDVWVADGVTEYQLDIWADNTELDGDKTDGVQWTRVMPPELAGLIRCVGAELYAYPREEHFFYPGHFFWVQIGCSFNVEILLVEMGQGVADRQGYLSTYYFVVEPGFVGETHFDLANTFMVDPYSNYQPHRVENDPFTVVAVCAADFNHDGSVNTLDVLAFLNAWAAGDDTADINGDGSVNTLDVLAFLNAWAAGC